MSISRISSPVLPVAVNPKAAGVEAGTSSPAKSAGSVLQTDPAATFAKASRIFRITNMRANANGLGSAGFARIVV
jgi:hypothetical protein